MHQQCSLATRQHHAQDHYTLCPFLGIIKYTKCSVFSVFVQRLMLRSLVLQVENSIIALKQNKLPETLYFEEEVLVANRESSWYEYQRLINTDWFNSHCETGNDHKPSCLNSIMKTCHTTIFMYHFVLTFHQNSNTLNCYKDQYTV
jgi:hypothetical protein